MSLYSPIFKQTANFCQAVTKGKSFQNVDEMGRAFNQALRQQGGGTGWSSSSLFKDSHCSGIVNGSRTQVFFREGVKMPEAFHEFVHAVQLHFKHFLKKTEKEKVILDVINKDSGLAKIQENIVDDLFFKNFPQAKSLDDGVQTILKFANEQKISIQEAVEKVMHPKSGAFDGIKNSISVFWDEWVRHLNVGNHMERQAYGMSIKRYAKQMPDKEMAHNLMMKKVYEQFDGLLHNVWGKKVELM